MKYKNIFFIVFLVGVSLLYTWYEAGRPQPLDWSETYSPEDKIPYGTYIGYRSLPHLFPSSKIVLSRLPVVEVLEQWPEEQVGCYLFVDRWFRPDLVEMNDLLEWVGNGNYLFVAAESIVDTLLQVWHLELNYGHTQADTVVLAGDKKKYTAFESISYFQPGKDFQGKLLGTRNTPAKPDFVQIPYGEGFVWLNLVPRAFTNIAVLDSVAGDYYYKALSCIPENGQTILWDAYTTLGAPGERTPFRVILKYPALTLALYLLLAGVLLYGLFRTKREQRPIPVVVPPRNRMLEFVATVSSLYWKQKEHTAIAMKQVDFFLEEIRTKYLISTEILDEQFVKLLSERAGVELETTRDLVALIRRIKETRQADEDCLKKLVKGTEEFLMRM